MFRDYDALLAELDANDGGTTHAFRQRLAQTAYARTGATMPPSPPGWRPPSAKRPRAAASSPVRWHNAWRYGENPHQSAAFYTDGSDQPGVATAVQHQGKELSYNNINDTDAAFRLVSEFAPQDGPACAIIKHANPCGVARGASHAAAFASAFDCDRTSAFGGIVALNGKLDGDTARAISEIFTEVVIAPDATDEAKQVFSTKKNLRLLTTGGLPDPAHPPPCRAAGLGRLAGPGRRHRPCLRLRPQGGDEKSAQR